MKTYEGVEACVEETLSRVGKKIVLAIPLGIGKPNQLVNEFFRRAVNDPRLDLTILTALSLNKPYWKSDLERRFKQPLVQRLYSRYPNLDYLTALQSGKMPANIRVREFYLNAGQFLHNPLVQRHYVSSNYTHVVRDALDRGINVFAQMISGQNEDGHYSLSCNTDLTLDLVPQMRERAKIGKPIAVLAQVNQELPFMPGDAVVKPEFFDAIISQPNYFFPPFVVPRLPINPRDYVIGLNVSPLIRDGGTLQLGIGSEGDAVAYFLLLRHQNPQRYQRLIRESGLFEHFGSMIEAIGGTEPFSQGLYGATEMLVPGFLDLLKGGVLKREVNGALVHACFFLGDTLFYDKLRKMSDNEKRRLQMTKVSFVNELYHDEELKRSQRLIGRFVNTGMRVTLTGAVISDTLDDHQVVSGVGGQYNFVAMAHALENSRSIILIRSTRKKGSREQSNIVWDHGSATIPRHLRDIIVTEYGVADLRGKSDEEVMQALLNICDSRFQEELLIRAKKAGKIDPLYQIPAHFAENLPKKIGALVRNLKAEGFCPDCPFGSDLSPEEIRLAKALTYLQALEKDPRRFWHFLKSIKGAFQSSSAQAPYLQRMQLDKPESIKLWLTQKLVLLALKATSNPLT